MYWQKLARGREFLNREDFFIGHTRRAFDSSEDEVVRGGIDSVYQCMAAYYGGEVSKRAYADFLERVWYVTERWRSEDTFDKLDTDGDGRISSQEFSQAAHSYLYSRVRNAAGAALFSEF